MEKDIENILSILGKSSIAKDKASSYSPLVLAYLGDAVYELIIRTRLVLKANRQVNKLHKESIKFVKAKAQASLGKQIFDKLFEDEKAVFKRGRNASPHTIAKNAGLSDYKYATAFEALIGYMYLCGNLERIIKLIDDCFIEDKENE